MPTVTYKFHSCRCTGTPDLPFPERHCYRQHHYCCVRCNFINILYYYYPDDVLPPFRNPISSKLNQTVSSSIILATKLNSVCDASVQPVTTFANPTLIANSLLQQCLQHAMISCPTHSETIEHKQSQIVQMGSLFLRKLIFKLGPSTLSHRLSQLPCPAFMSKIIHLKKLGRNFQPWVWSLPSHRYNYTRPIRQDKTHEVHHWVNAWPCHF